MSTVHCSKVQDVVLLPLKKNIEATHVVMKHLRQTVETGRAKLLGKAPSTKYKQSTFISGLQIFNLYMKFITSLETTR